MLSDSTAFSGFAVDDLDAARTFYGETLGLELADEGPGFVLALNEGARPTLVYPRPGHVPAEYTILNFDVADVEAEVDALDRARRGLRALRGRPAGREGHLARARTRHRLVQGPGRQHPVDPQDVTAGEPRPLPGADSRSTSARLPAIMPIEASPSRLRDAGTPPGARESHPDGVMRRMPWEDGLRGHESQTRVPRAVDSAQGGGAPWFARRGAPADRGNGVRLRRVGCREGADASVRRAYRPAEAGRRPGRPHACDRDGRRRESKRERHQNDLKQIRDAQGDLNDERKQQVEVGHPGVRRRSQDGRSRRPFGSLCRRRQAKLQAAGQQLAGSYQQTFAKIDCG